MKQLLKIFLVFGVLACASTLKAQNMSDMRLNEIVITNNTGYIDDYGNRSAWIELFNTSQGTVDIAGCYLSDDPNDLRKYKIPKGDVLTKVKPRQHILFYADNEPDKGTFHISFKLDSTTKEIYFVSTDGRTIIDKVSLEGIDIPADLSYGRKIDGEGSSEPTHFLRKSYLISKKEENAKGDHGWGILTKVTPSSNNVIDNADSKLLILEQNDPYGAVMAITAMSVVFLALILLYIVFKNTGKYSIKKSKVKEIVSKGGTATYSTVDHTGDATSAEVFAAVAMALHLYKTDTDNEIHDIENTILTIHKESKTYSPWSSKIYTLRETPQIKKHR